MKIHLHIGVHKTATTYMQNMLHENQVALRAARIGYIRLWDLRPTFTRSFMSFVPGEFKIEDMLPRFFGGKVPDDIQGLVISDENVIGHCGGPLMLGYPFDKAKERLAHLRALLAGHEITMFCAIRSYESFLSSAYCQGIRDSKKFVPFETFKNRLQWSKMQWPYLLNRFETGLCPETVKLWRYEDFRQHSARIMDEMLFNSGLGLKPPSDENAEYPSFSGTTLQVLEAVAKVDGAEAASAMVDQIAAAFPKGNKYPGFDPWSKQETELLKQLYQSDCGAIGAEKWLLGNTQPVSKAA